MRFFLITFGSLRIKKARALLLAGSIALTAAAIVSIMLASSSASTQLQHTLDTVGANIIVAPGSSELDLEYAGIKVDGFTYDFRELTIEDVDRINTIKNRENIAVIAPKLVGAAKLSGLNAPVLVVGVDFEAEQKLKHWWNVSGDFPTGINEAVVGSELATELGVKAGNKIRLGDRYFVVTGILEPTQTQDDRVVFVPLESAQALFNKPGKVSFIEVAALCYDCPIEKIVSQISEKIPDANVQALKEVIESRMAAVNYFKRFGLLVSGFITLISILIIFILTTLSVVERTREIGILRAIGYHSTHIFSIVLLEVVVLSGIGGITGSIAGIYASHAVLQLIAGYEAVLVLHWNIPLFAAAGAVLAGLVGALYPSFRATRIDPAAALRFV